ncbi:hypothetical protein B0H13DRAFT_1918852 [Mycena leptocephala]|nr:hypothetical protein B0H13DRAFT_1918852 [Mycena leptocephala]
MTSKPAQQSAVFNFVGVGVAINHVGDDGREVLTTARHVTEMEIFTTGGMYSVAEDMSKPKPHKPAQPISNTAKRASRFAKPVRQVCYSIHCLRHAAVEFSGGGAVKGCDVEVLGVRVDNAEASVKRYQWIVYTWCKRGQAKPSKPVQPNLNSDMRGKPVLQAHPTILLERYLLEEQIAAVTTPADIRKVDLQYRFNNINKCGITNIFADFSCILNLNLFVAIYSH